MGGVSQIPFWMAGELGAEPSCRLVQGGLAAGGDREQLVGAALGRGGTLGSLFEHGVGIGATHTEGAHGRPSGRSSGNRSKMSLVT